MFRLWAIEIKLGHNSVSRMIINTGLWMSKALLTAPGSSKGRKVISIILSNLSVFFLIKLYPDKLVQEITKVLWGYFLNRSGKSFITMFNSPIDAPWIQIEGAESKESGEER